jgi:hypothetical protein
MHAYYYYLLSIIVSGPALAVILIAMRALLIGWSIHQHHRNICNIMYGGRQIIKVQATHKQTLHDACMARTRTAGRQARATGTAGRQTRATGTAGRQTRAKGSD